MIDYDAEFHDPPAPMARITLGHPDSDAKLEDLPMLLDTGADGTLLPTKYVLALGLEPLLDEGAFLESYAGDKATAAYVIAVITLGTFIFRGEYYISPVEVGVIGRDLLNKVLLELHGPQRAWIMTKSRV